MANPTWDVFSRRMGIARHWWAGVALVLFAASGSACADILMASPVQVSAEPVVLELTDRAVIASGIAPVDILQEGSASSVAGEMTGYFLSDGVGFHHTPGFTADEPLVIFADASSPNLFFSSATSPAIPSQPLLPGDVVASNGSGDSAQQGFFPTVAESADGALGTKQVDQMLAFARATCPYIPESSEPSILPKSPPLGVAACEPGWLGLLVLACGGWLRRSRRSRTDPRGCPDRH